MNDKVATRQVIPTPLAPRVAAVKISGDERCCAGHVNGIGAETSAAPKPYRASDDDLPEIFWSGEPRVAPYPPREDLQRAVAAQVHFPAVSAPLTHKQQRDLERDRKDREH
jgi:hypothetical protein